MPLEATSGTQSSSKTVKDSSIQDPSEDADTQIPKSLYPAHLSKTSSDQSSEVRPLSPSTAVLVPLPTSIEIHENGASTSFSNTAQSPTSDENPDHNLFSSGLHSLSPHGGLLQESKDPQGTTTADPDSWRFQSQPMSEVLTASRNLPKQTDEKIDGPSTVVVADPLADLGSVLESPREPGIGSTIGSLIPAALQKSLYGSKTRGQQQPQTSSFDLNIGDESASATAAESESSLDGKPDHSAPATLLESSPPSQTRPSQLTPAISTAFKQLSDPEPDPSSTFPTSLMSDSNAREASAPTTVKGSPDVTPDPLAKSVHENANTLSDPQSESSSSINAVLGNQTAVASQLHSMSTAGRLAAASSSMNNVVRYKGGGKKNTSFRLEVLSIWLASVFLLLFSNNR